MIFRTEHGEMAAYTNLGKMFRCLCLADCPVSLWEIIDGLATQHPLGCNGVGPEEILINANSIVLYGAGKFSEAVIDSWNRKDIRPDYCVDSDTRKWGARVNNILVCDPQVLFKCENTPLVVIAAMTTNEIEKVLEERNIPHLYAERDGSVGYFSGHWLSQHRLEFERVYSLLADDESRRVMMGVAKARMFQYYNFPMRGNYFSSEVASSPQYFLEDIFSFSKQEFFVDCGAFDGDTLIAFAALMWRMGIESWSAVAFEADKRNADLVEHNLKRYGINCAKVICAAVGKDDTIASSTSYFNCRQDDGYGEVQTVSLDKALCGVSPTFIKMDIEGYELDALLGAKKLILMHHPKLAICSYHTSSQLLEIPLFILDNFPDYRLYMRHHSAGTLWETACYAVPG